MRCRKLMQGIVIGLLGVAVFLPGCTTTPSSHTGELQDSNFISLWKAYADCKSTSDLTQATADLHHLRSSGHLGIEKEGFILPLPARIAHLVANPTNRIAVDVQAMASACALHTGELALNEGYVDIARDLFVSIITLHSEENSYYATKAKTLLARLAQGINVTFNTR